MYIIRDDELNYIKDEHQRNIIANILYILNSKILMIKVKC